MFGGGKEKSIIMDHIRGLRGTGLTNKYRRFGYNPKKIVAIIDKAQRSGLYKELEDKIR